MSHDCRYRPEELTLLARLTTRLGQGPGLLHEVRCKPMVAPVLADGPHYPDVPSWMEGPSWLVLIPNLAWNKRVDVVVDALVRFPRSHWRTSAFSEWHLVTRMRHVDGAFEVRADTDHRLEGHNLASVRRWLERRELPPVYLGGATPAHQQEIAR